MKANRSSVSEADRLRPWAEAVFHVLAQVPARAPCAASLYDPHYVAFAEKTLGPAIERPLGQDVQVLSSLLATHESMAAVQLLAWLFRTPEEALQVAEYELAQVPPERLLHPSWLSALQPYREAAELLWASVLLEQESLAALPHIEIDIPALDRALEAASVAAPLVRDCDIAFVRALRLRGRVANSEIWVGVPSESLNLSIDQVVWQACHEASVLEVNRAARSAAVHLEHASSEHAAVVLLAERAKASGLEKQHATWFSHFGSHAPSLSRGSLEPDPGRVVQQLLERCPAPTARDDQLSR